MKKFIYCILSFCFMFTIVFSLVGCKDNNENLNQTVSKIQLDYIKNLQLSTTNNTAYGIKKSTIESPSVASDKLSESKKSNASFVSFKSVANYDNNQTESEKYYLYSTTQTYKNGIVEYDENSITKVTFKKNSTITEDVYDNNGNIISSNQTITQEEIEAQINKLYVTENYIFMQFIPLLSESGNYNYYDGDTLKTEYLAVRPSSLTYDLNGISEFDTTNYYSSALSQSFVINNETGYIYKIENFSIASIIDSDLVKDKNNNFYKMSINNQGTLSFRDVMPNKDVKINKIITDKYGYTFVYNEKIDQVDKENKIIYFKYVYANKHLYDENKVVYLISYEENTHIERIQKFYDKGILQDVDSDLTCFGFTCLENTNLSLIGYYKGKRIYNFNFYTEGGQLGLEDSIKVSTSPILNPMWFDYNSILIYRDNILYGKLVNLDEYYNTDTILNIEDFTIISEDPVYKYTDKYYINVGNDKKQISNVYYKTTLTGTAYYQLVRNGDAFQLELLEDKNYTQNVFIFQPINK